MSLLNRPARAPHDHRVNTSHESKESLATKRPSRGRDHNTRPRPSNGISQPRPNGPVARRQDDWTHWAELAVYLSQLPPSITTKDVWLALKGEGQIVTIELFEDTAGARNGRARVRFSPPPAKAFWQTGRCLIQVEASVVPYQAELQLENKRRTFLAPSPVDPQVKYPETMTLKATCLDFGFMYEPTTMMAMYRVQSSAASGIIFRQSMLHREIDIAFQLDIRDPRLESQRPLKTLSGIGKRNRTEMFRFRIPFAQPLLVHEVSTTTQTVLLISMESPPNFYRKFDESATHELSANFWTHMDAWFRQTDILYDTRKLREAPLTLKKSKPIIDIGRWTTYRFVFDLDPRGRDQYKLMCKALKDFNIEVKPMEGFMLITNREPAVWEYIDKPIIKQRSMNTSVLDELIEDGVQPLSFPVRYQLEVCISQGYLNEHNLTREFVNKLMDMKQAEAQDVLECVANQRKRIYRPMEIFNIKIIKGSASRLKVPHYCTYIRSATVTPSTVYYSTPTVETSNRVVRQYAEYGDRFLRVRFSDEKFQGRIFSTDKETLNEVFTRIKRIMINGITIGDRHFEFLAFGNSQFREHGAYFFAPLEHLRPEGIRSWMGYFGDIKVVAKHAARLGQCFSTTRAINGTKVKIVEIEDIQRGEYNFTDGVGKISKFLAQMAASELGLNMPSGEPPSVFQFRLGGCKGVLALSPDVGMREIHIRKSQYKFPASHEGLEIIRWSKPASAYLNRQLILVLSTLQVPDRVFINMLKQQLSNLEQAMTDEKIALKLLQKEIDPNQMTLTLAAMLLEGFQRVREPFMLSLLQLWRAWSIKYLKEKAKIVVNQGALLFGCIDETATLKGHFNNKQPGSRASEKEKMNSLPEIFIQLSKGVGDKPEVIKGPIILARNPSLHPGDIRIVRGVDVPALRHLKDVVVLPQTGDRDVSGMCSGGDLDGDDYVVIWDKDLIPLQWNHEPMDYTPPKPLTVARKITTDDTTSFFVTYMKNDSLPRIAHAHLATADFMDDGVKNDRCLRLAALHSLAVDYVKTGVPAIMPADLRPRKWPHFMEKFRKPKEQTYTSEKVLGQLYDQVERVDFVPEFTSSFDWRILGAYAIDQKLRSDAAEVKELYDTAMYRIMAQHDIQTEFEVWSTFVMHHANQSKDFKFHEEMGEISTALKDRFRSACYDKAGGKDFDKIGPFVAAMYRVTSDQMTQALQECEEVIVVGGREKKVKEISAKTMPLMSFPWLFPSVLGKIASGELHPPKEANAKLLQAGHKNVSPKRHRVGAALLEEDTLQTHEGITHRGDILELFHHDEEERAKEMKGNNKNLQAEVPIAGSAGASIRNATVDSLLDLDLHEEKGLHNQIPVSILDLEDSRTDSLLDENSPQISHVALTSPNNWLEESLRSNSAMDTPAEGEISEVDAQVDLKSRTMYNVTDATDDIELDFTEKHRPEQKNEAAHEREHVLKAVNESDHESEDEAEDILIGFDDKPSLLEQLELLLES